jgi:hypothetical protein
MSDKPEVIEQARGLSVFDSWEAAVHRMTNAKPIPGDYITVLEIPLHVPVHFRGRALDNLA